MEGVVFDDYMECALQRDLNKLTRAKEDTSAVVEALRVVREFLAKRALDKLDLNSATEETVDCEPWHDASAFIDIVEEEVCMSSTSICAYLPPSRDPTYNFAKAGFIVFQDSVSMSAPSHCVKGIRTCSDVILSALQESGDAAIKATQALKNAQSAAHSYYGACAGSLVFHDFPHCPEKTEHLFVELQTAVLRWHSDFEKSVYSAVSVMQHYIEQYNKLCEAAKRSVNKSSSSRSQRAIDDVAYLRNLHDRSKMFSSDKWICVLINQL